MEFWHYDLIFLAVFSIAVALFLFKRRKNLKFESRVFVLYRTKVGIRFINYVGSRFRGFFKYMSYVVISTGYILMIASLYFFIEIVVAIIRMPMIIKIAKVPPIMPLIPYLPQMFNIDFLPPFYFTYWIISIAIIAICHEFAHGIFAKYAGVRIKATGFGFLGPFLAAFVEPDEKQLARKNKKAQLAVLSAGSFANLVVTIIFLAVFICFFIVFFSPAGVSFGYIPADINIRDITWIGTTAAVNLSAAEFASFIDNFKAEENVALEIKSGKNTVNLTGIMANNKTYFLIIGEEFKASIKTLGESVEKNENINETIRVLESTPALRAGLSGAITDINHVSIKSVEKLAKEIGKYKPGDEVFVETIDDEFNKMRYSVVLEESPYEKSKAFLGIGLLSEEPSGRGILKFITQNIIRFRKPNIYYKPVFRPYLVIFIYNLIWWIVLINISIALVNMLPVGIFDGGRVFYLTALALTKSEKKAKNAFKFVTMLVVLLFLLIMLLWFIYI